ncbi:YdcF family protein [Dokdonella sp.]|uniref:YdcF family protein n=1 Tax=Dokdonella sp. TaxID=2291710 RepID=UPI0031C7E4C8|nr:YdcF family protein [Dokdonella sp.]
MHFVLSPLTWLLVALLVAWYARRWRSLLRLALAAAAFSYVLITPLGANLLVRAVESRVPAAPACTAPAPAVVVLAGGFDHAPRDGADVAALSGTTLRRTLVGVERFRDSAATRLVLSGGGPYAVKEAELMARFAARLGVPAEAIEIERSSHDTWQSAQTLASHDPALPRHFVLVSSALHLPRALVAFHAAGFEPCPLASESRYLPPGGIGYLLPHSSSLAKGEAAIHELVGGLAYRVRARLAGHGAR